MLDTLVAEVVEHILGFLDDRLDLFAVRLVCRQLCSKSFQTFATTWFNTINSDLSQRSLCRLEKIAKHEALRSFPYHLHIGAGKQPYSDSPLGLGNQWIRTDSGCLDTSSIIIANFRNWLANKLVNCRSFEVTDTCGRCPEQNGTSISLSPADAIQLLFAATAGLPVRAFRINLHRAPSILYPSQLSPSTIKPGQFGGAWASNLQDLELVWDLERDDIHEMALEMIVKATNLRRLRLGWHNSDASQHFFHSLGKVAKLPQIRELRLDTLGSITQATLLGFLSRLQDSLTSLSLSRVHLSSGSWSTIFRELATILPHLEQITHWNCYDGPRRGRVFFCPLRENSTRKEYGEFRFLEVTYKRKLRLGGVRFDRKGKGMQLALKALEDSVFTLCQNGPPSPGYSDQKSVNKFDPRKFPF